MTILITGAAGFLGRRLVADLAANGERVIALYRSTRPRDLDLPSVEWVQCDLATQTLDPAAFPPIDTIVHLAGETAGARPAPGTAERFYLVANEATTIAVLEAFAPRARRVVLASSQVVYGAHNGLTVAEDEPVSGRGAYSVSKLNSEHWAREFQAQHGGAYIALRLTGFIDGGGLVDYLIDTALAGGSIELFAGGEICRDYLPAEDGIRALRLAVQTPVDDGFWPVNIGSGQQVTARELADIVQQTVGSDRPVVLSDRPAQQGNFVFDVTRAEQLLGFVPGDLKTAVRSYATGRATQHSG